MLAMCDRFHKLPSEIENEGSELIRMVTIEQLAMPPEATEEEG